MRRVSSRQRLVSWDAFDATAKDENDLKNKSAVCYSDVSLQSSRYETTGSPSSILNAGTCCNEHMDFDKTDDEQASRRRKRDRESFRSAVQRIGRNSGEPKSASSSPLPPSTGIPNIIPSYYWEINKNPIDFDSLIDDACFNIFSFLDLSSIRSFMSLNRHYRQLMLSNDAKNSFWTNNCQKIWKLLEGGKGQYHQPPSSVPTLIDNFCLPIAAAPKDYSDHPNSSIEINLPLLLSLTPEIFPTCVDQDLLSTRNRSRQQTDAKLLRFYQHAETGLSLVRYVGPVGQGDRCIRSNCPLPRPSSRGSSLSSSSSGRSDIISNNNFRRFGAVLSGGGGDGGGGHRHYNPQRPFLMNILRRGPKSMIGAIRDSSSRDMDSPALLKYKPFVVPFLDTKRRKNKSIVNVTPRFISYYEVTILEVDDDDGDDNRIPSLHGNLRSPRSALFRPGLVNSDCVAVGVATKSFHVHSRMPGWDRQSFGYHGDDGGIFHSSGGMLKTYGPKFGSGDTIGCGIDYVSKGIFYTLNGRFLGYAFENIEHNLLDTDLYPVVGLDSNFPIHLNFGTDNESFQFDLSRFIMKHEKIVTTAYSMNESSLSATQSLIATTSKTRYNYSSIRRQKRKSFSGRKQSLFR